MPVQKSPTLKTEGLVMSVGRRSVLAILLLLYGSAVLLFAHINHWMGNVTDAYGGTTGVNINKVPPSPLAPASSSSSSSGPPAQYSKIQSLVEQRRILSGAGVLHQENSAYPESLRDLAMQIDALEVKEAALSDALAAWRSTGLLPTRTQLLKAGIDHRIASKFPVDSGPLSSKPHPSPPIQNPMVESAKAALAEAEKAIAKAEATVATRKTKLASASTIVPPVLAKESIPQRERSAGYFSDNGSFRLRPPPHAKVASEQLASYAPAAKAATSDENAIAGSPSSISGSLQAALAGNMRRLAARDTSVLVVGGSDGSGTRSVVALLEKLGVFMIVDDRGTNDVHAEEMGGWPPVVKPVLSAMHSANFDLAAVPRNVKEGTIAKMTRFLDSMRRQGSAGGKRLKDAADAAEEAAVASGSNNGDSTRPRKAGAAFVARGVAYGYKAPVSMLLVPFLALAYQREAFKFLHVVRDGRDIAFSGNQSPVNKFYRDSYANGADKFERWNAMPEVRGIQLWSDWNSDVYEWGAARNAAQDPNVEYLKVHTEDLIDPATKFETVRQIAGFIGSDAFTNDELCCLVVQPEEFMGSHSLKGGRGEKGSAASKTLSSRFGHWRSKLKGKSALSEAMHREGARGLQLFGYRDDGTHPPPPPPHDAYVCSLTTQQCNAMGISFTSLRQPHGQRGRGGKETGSRAIPVDNAQCGYAKDTDYRGGGVDITMNDAASAAECCVSCRRHSACGYFTYDPNQRLCYLKKGTGNVVSALGLISGKAAGAL